MRKNQDERRNTHRLREVNPQPSGAVNLRRKDKAMTKKQKDKIITDLEKRGISYLPDGYYILKLDRGNYSLRNGKTGNTVDVGGLKEILELV